MSRDEFAKVLRTMADRVEAGRAHLQIDGNDKQHSIDIVFNDDMRVDLLVDAGPEGSMLHIHSILREAASTFTTGTTVIT